MVSMVGFTDATNPLFIRKGNPDLKNAPEIRRQRVLRILIRA